MNEWLKISLILCTFGFFREFRPSEPFVTEFLSGEWRNITSEQVNREVYPVGTYSYLAQLVIIFIITDMLRYKPIIILSACAGIIVFSLLLWTDTLFGLQICQFVYGTYMAAEVAYYTYIYAKVDREKYQQVSGHARAGVLSGRFLASVVAQILISFNIMDVRELTYISLGSQCVSLLWTLVLPSVVTSVYFYAPKTVNTNLNEGSINLGMTLDEFEPNNQDIKLENTSGINNIKSNDESSVNSKSINKKEVNGNFSCTRAFSLLWKHFIMAYSNKIVIMWSLWWSLAMCGFLLVQSYVQLLWQQIEPDRESIFNGGIEAALTLLAAISALGAGYLDVDDRLRKWEIWILTACSAIEGAIIIVGALTENIWISYIMYVAFGVLYQFMITMASAAVAKNLNEDSFALIFGINTFMALLFQTIMTIVVISDTAFNLNPRQQFTVFGAYFLALSIIYGITGIVLIIYDNKKKN